MSDIIQAGKNMGLFQNVSLRVIDPVSMTVVSEHVGHNNATNTLLTGVAHHLKGDGILNQGAYMLYDYIPRYISLGTMGLINQDQNEDGTPAGLGVVSWLGSKYEDMPDEDLAILGKEPTQDLITPEDDEYIRYVDYMYQRPGFGADGYDINSNNSRKYFGLGPVFKEREDRGQTDDDGTVHNKLTINCELITDSHPRALINFRDIVPEIESEIPRTIDAIFSAMIPLGGLADFREGENDYVFVTEAGLWSSPDWNNSGSNGLLAGYRICPSSSSQWDMSVKENREALRKSIIKVKKGQIVQVIWKIQLGSVDQFGGIDALYPGKVKKYWTELPTRKIKET